VGNLNHKINAPLPKLEKHSELILAISTFADWKEDKPDFPEPLTLPNEASLL